MRANVMYGENVI